MLPCKLSAYQLTPMDTLQYTHDRFAWAAKSSEAAEVALAVEGDNDVPTPGIDLALPGSNSGVYAWTPASD